MTADPPRVVVLDSDPDTSEMLQMALEAAQFTVVPGNLHEFRTGQQDLFAFLEEVRPDVILYDLSPPYDTNWSYLENARQHPTFAGCGLVITTTNRRAVEQLVSLPVLEIYGKPYDLDVLVGAVRHALSPSRGDAPAGERRRRPDRRAGDDRRSGTDRRADGSLDDVGKSDD